MKSSPVLKPAKSHATTSSSPPRPAIPDVPPNSWYAQRYADAVNTPISEIHSRKRGDILFATQPFMAEVCSPQMPANHQRTNSTTSFRSDADDGEDGSSAASPLFPSSTQPQLPTATCSNVQVGRDLLYVLGCLTNTSLFTEYNWRRRCAYKKEVEKGMVPLPELIQRQKMAQRKHLVASAGQNGAVEDEMLVTAEQYERGLNEAYNCPPKEMRVGVKLFVNDELVPDHYPGLHALPQCTATLDSVEVFRHWVAVPLVLIGYLNHFTLDRISISRTLSLTFVEHLLQMNRSSHSGTTSDANISSKIRSRSPSQQQGGGGASTREHNLRVELVYGCRSEGFFCTDFISRGSCTFTLAQSSKPALKAYEESLRQLIQARRSAATIFLAPRPSSTSAATKKPIATCRNCGHPLIYRCSICAAELCGRLECVRRNVRGYPRGCAEHEAQERRRVSQTPAS